MTRKWKRRQDMRAIKAKKCPECGAYSFAASYRCVKCRDTRQVIVMMKDVMLKEIKKVKHEMQPQKIQEN